MEVEQIPKLTEDEEQEKVIKTLGERLEEHDRNRKAVQDKLRESRNNFATQIDELEDRVSKDLEEKFIHEDDRLQATLKELRGNNTPSALQKVRAELLVEQLYEILDNSSNFRRDFTTLCELKAEKRLVPELMEVRKPTNICATGVNRGGVSVEFTCLDPNEERVLSDRNIVNPVKYKCLLFKKGNEQEGKEYLLDKNEDNEPFFTLTPDLFEVETTYEIRVKMVVGDKESEWSDDVVEFTTSEFKKCCTWKKCPGYVDEHSKYIVDEKNPRIVTSNNDSIIGNCCAVIGNTHIPLNTVTSWNIKILKSEDNNGNGIYIGIAPSDINQNAVIWDKRGWYFDCYSSTLHSGPPHKYGNKRYGLYKGSGQYVHTGDSVGVVVDTTKGELSFALNGVNLDVAYEGIPLDKPLVPCVLLYFHKDDSVELDTFEVKEKMDDPNPVPSNIITEKSENPCCSDKLAEERERLIKLLEERLAKHEDNRKAAQDKLHEICDGLRTQISGLEDGVSKGLEEKFTLEDDRLQAALNELRENSTPSALQKAKAELLVEQLYEMIENKKIKHDFTTMYELKVEKRIVPELMETRKPTNIRVTGVNSGRISVKFTFLNPDEEKVLSDKDIVNPIKLKCLLFKKGDEQDGKEYLLDKDEGNDSSSSFTFTPDALEAETTYNTKIKIILGDSEYEWSDEFAEFTTPEFKDCCVWKKYPEDANKWLKYNVDDKDSRIATKVNSNDYCTIIGNTLIPPNAVTSWSIKILKSEDNNGDNISIGIAPFDIKQNNGNNRGKCGWYFDCMHSALYSGPPHNYIDKDYGPRKVIGQYVHTGDSIGVVVDAANGELSFILNGMNYNVAYEGIPLDKPLVPCVLLWHEYDSVELDTSEVKDEVDSSIPVPSNITAKSTTYDSITLAWGEVDNASHYRVEVDRSKKWDISTTNTFTKGRLLPETEHSFRVRTVKGYSVSEWSGVVKGRTLKAPEFSECVWKECPGDVDKDKKYIVDEDNPRIATKVNSNGSYCTIIGNTLIPPNKVTPWSVKVLKSKDNDGRSILIGVAPFDIDQNNEYNYNKCGWHFDCYCSSLRSGPPHNYRGEGYGSRKENGRYMRTGSSVDVVVDTVKGELSFYLNNVNLGVAYEGIPLDKPLVPCVLLRCEGDSVELDIPEVKDDSCVIS